MIRGLWILVFILCIGCPKMPSKTPLPQKTASELHQILEKKILQVYQINQLENPGKIYEALKKVFAGPLLEREFFELLAGKDKLERNNTSIGDTQIGFSPEVLLLEKHLDSYLLAIEWEAKGDIWHLLHRHTRHNQYIAKFTLAYLNNQWKITHFQVELEVRIDKGPGK